MTENKPSGATTARRRDLPALAPRRRIVRIVRSPDASAVGREIPLDGKSWTIGRADDAPISIVDPQMSRSHVTFKADGDSYLIQDLGGRNGTFVDGSRLERPEPLRAHQVIEVGETLLVVDEEPRADRMPASAENENVAIQELVGVSLAAQRMRCSIATVARAEGTVLLLGPTGTGKEVAAHAIHRLSGRSGPFVPLNCAAIPKDLAESELFGHKKGAFTGATADRNGAFRDAEGGTLFLDEVGDLPESVQAKLLRVLEDGSIQPVGGSPSRVNDVRVVAATHSGLEEGNFRRDLLARLGDWTLHLPTLAERRADILTVWWHFYLQAAPGRRTESTTEFAEGLLLHDWPMNVRELRKMARRVATLAGKTEVLDVDRLSEEMQRKLLRGDREAPLPVEVVIDPENRPTRVVLETLLKKHRGNVSAVSREGDWYRTDVYRWCKKEGLDPDAYR